MSLLLELQNIHKHYQLGEKTIQVINGISLKVNHGDFLAVMGTSGSGKSTLMYILGSLVSPDTGAYFLQDREMLSLDDAGKSWVRANWLGFVFQTFHLLPELTVFDNVALPFLYKKVDPRTKKERILRAIQRVGLEHRRQHRPAELSGGEMQRAAIARALVVEPLLILADEPTGNLDSQNSQEILDLFAELNQTGSTIIMVTHDPQVAATADMTLHMKDGILYNS